MRRDTEAFLERLCLKDRRRTSALYSSTASNKENMNSQGRQHPKRKAKEDQTHKSMQRKWWLDVGSSQVNSVGQWLCLESGLCQFQGICRRGQIVEQIGQNLKQMTQKQAIVVELWSGSDKESRCQSLINWAMNWLQVGKGEWSVLALAGNKKYDLLSYNGEASALWKGSSQPLTKIQFNKAQLVRRVLGFAGEKEKSLPPHQTLAKLRFSNGNTIYFMFKDISTANQPSKAHLLIEQQITLQGLTKIMNYPIIQAEQAAKDEHLLRQLLHAVGIPVRKEAELGRVEHERYLKSMVDELSGQLQSQQSQLKLYQSTQVDWEEEEQPPIPSERAQLSTARANCLVRQIKQPLSPSQVR